MSLRDFFRHITPARHNVHKHRHYRMIGQVFGKRLHDPELWRLTRRSVAGGVAVGAFIAALPIFGQMLLAAVIAFWLRVNLPTAVVFTWLSNPITFPPFFYVSYKLGNRLLGLPMEYKEFHLSLTWLGSVIHDIWLPLLIGCLIFGIAGAIVGYYTVSGMWRLLLMRKRDHRRTTRPFMRVPGSSDDSPGSDDDGDRTD
ncbi:MAG: DUF2062 domain-containing protein [Gammaproteobacteria bacterium]